MSKSNKHSLKSRIKRTKENVGEKNPFFGKSHSKESRKKMSLAHKGKRNSPKTEFKKDMVPWNKGKSPSKKSIEKRKKTMEDRYYSNPKARLELRKKNSESTKKLWTSPEYKKRQIESHKKYFSNPEARKRQSKIIKNAKFSNRNTRFKKGHKVPEKIKQKLREHTLKMYKSNSFPKQLNTKIEIAIRDELIKRGYKKGTDFIQQFIFNKKFSCDFCFPKQKIILEAYGDFWHCNPRTYPNGPTHKHQVKGINRDKSKEAYITKVDNGSWTYLYLWESDIKENVSKCVDKIEKVLKKIRC
jgi:G:T-mismatch repair DNA endonuclease (very short patch repair protein)